MTPAGPEGRVGAWGTWAGLKGHCHLQEQFRVRLPVGATPATSGTDNGHRTWMPNPRNRKTYTNSNSIETPSVLIDQRNAK